MIYAQIALFATLVMLIGAAVGQHNLGVAGTVAALVRYAGLNAPAYQQSAISPA